MKNNKWWDVTPKDAVALQKELRTKVNISPLNKEIKTIAGADVSLNMFSPTLYAGIIVLSYPDLKEIEYSVIKTETTFPYIPGLLSFREIPGLMECFNKLKTKPDLVVVDGQGIAHPRRLGIATHFGILADIPTIGAAKSVLTGEYDVPGEERGNFSYMYDRFNHKEIIGAAVRTKNKVKPMIISPGNKVSVDQSIDIILKTTLKHRLPEPTRLAHELVNKFRRGEIK